jgi:aarF domain-containing kinase
VNRVKIIGHWASRSLAKAPDLTFSQRVVEYGHRLAFILTIFATDVAFWFSKVRRLNSLTMHILNNIIAAMLDTAVD